MKIFNIIKCSILLMFTINLGFIEYSNFTGILIGLFFTVIGGYSLYNIFNSKTQEEVEEYFGLPKGFCNE